MDIFLPHIRYIEHPSDKRRPILYFFGSGESGLIVGKQYNLSRAMFSNDSKSPRLAVWYCKEDNKYFNFYDLRDFCTLEQLRDKKIEQITK